MADDPQLVKLRGVRLSFPSLWQARSSVKGSEPKFGCDFIIDPDTRDGKKNLDAIEDAIFHIEEEEFGRTGVKYKDGRLCLAEGDDRVKEDTGEPYDGYAGMMYLSAKSTKRPRVDDSDGSPLSEQDGIPYGGCYVNAMVRLYGVSSKDKGGMGIFANLLAVVFVKDGEAFGGATNVDEEIQDLYEKGDGDDEGGEGSRRRGSGRARASRDDGDDGRDRGRDRRGSGRGRGADDDDDDGGDDSRSDRRGRGRRDADENGDDVAPRRSRRSRDGDDDDDAPGRGRPSRRGRDVDDEELR